MSRKTVYEIVYSNNREDLLNKEFKSITSINKILTPNDKVTAAWFEIDTKLPKDDYFYKFKIGFREFEKLNDGTLSYSRFPMFDY